MNPTIADLCVVYNTGGLGPNPYAKHGWQVFWEGAEKYPLIMLHNLAHWVVPMQWAQVSYLRSMHGDSPVADMKAFGKYARQRKQPWYMYLGSPETFYPFPGESARNWRSRAIDEIRPIIEARPTTLFLDAFQEINEERYELLIDKLQQDYGIQVGIEPCCYADQTAMHTFPVAIQTEFIEKRAGASGWDTGKNAARPLRNPSLHPYALELVRGKNVPIEIEEARARGYVPAVKVLKLPVGIE